MDATNSKSAAPDAAGLPDIRNLVKNVLEEMAAVEHQRAEPAYKVELTEERRRRESLEKRVNELIEENKRSRAAADEADRASQIRAELQRLGVQKVDLAFRVVKDDIRRGDGGDLIARTGEGEQSYKEYLASFVSQNPEFLPPRIAGGSGSSSAKKESTHGASIDIERIRPGMSQEELQRVRDQIALVASQALRGE